MMLDLAETRRLERDELLAALKASAGYLRNARIDLATGATKATAIRTIDGGLRGAELVIAKFADIKGSE